MLPIFLMIVAPPFHYSWVSGCMFPIFLMIVSPPFHYSWVSGCIFLIFLMIVATWFQYSWFCCNMFPLFLIIFATLFWFRVWQTMSRSAPSVRRRIRKSWISSNPRMQPGSECSLVSWRNVNKTLTLHRWVCLHSSHKLPFTFL